MKVALSFLDENNQPMVKRSLKSTWNIELDHDPKIKLEDYRDKVRNEVSEILSEHIRMEITPEVIKEMLKDIDKGSTPIAKNSIMETINENKCERE